MIMRCLILGFFLTCVTTASVQADEITSAVKTLQSVEPGGKGTAAARKAAELLSNAGDKALLPVLKGFKDADPLAANWLRNSFEQIIDGIRAADKKLPVAELEAFIRDQKQSAVARRLAYESLKVQIPEIEARLIPECLLDASPEFRRDAVAMLIKQASAATDVPASIPLYRKALQGAVHEDQVQTIAEALRKDGETVDIQKHFGFLPQWFIVGPFDNKDEKGFAVPYAPETEASISKGADFADEYDGQLGKVQWKPLASEDDYGVIDIAKQLENHKGSLMYARTTWTSRGDQQVQIRLGTPNSWKLWVNGTLVFEREEYHRSSQMDQYSVPVSLKAGENFLLLKVCQNEMTQDWAQRYQFQVRICDGTGSAVLPLTTTASNDSLPGVSR